MTTDTQKLANGLALEKDLVFPSKPDHPEMRESVSIWLFEENGKFAFPRMGIEAEASSWDNRRLQGNFSFANGRVLNGAGIGPAPSAIDRDGASDHHRRRCADVPLYRAVPTLGDDVRRSGRRWHVRRTNRRQLQNEEDHDDKSSCMPT